MKKKFLFIATLVVMCSANIKAQDYAVRVNLPSLALGNINADISYAMSNNFSLHLQGQMKPFDYKIPTPMKLSYLYDKNIGWSKLFDFSLTDHTVNYMIQPGVRYWTSGVYNRGFFFGVSAIGCIYKLGGDWIDSSYRKGFAVGGGLSSGYSYELSKLFNIEFELGIGVYYSKYHKLPKGDNNVGFLDGELTDVKLFPSSAAISLVYLF